MRTFFIFFYGAFFFSMASWLDSWTFRMTKVVVLVHLCGIDAALAEQS
jgi:hypothetical protein